VTHPYVVGLLAAIATLAFVVEMLRRGILREKYAALWLLVAGGLLVVAAFPGVLTSIAAFVGVKVPANLLFFVSGIVLLLVSVQLSYEVSRLEARTRRLAEEVALLRNAINGGGQPPGPPPA
jgi:hypothetical protein